MRKQLRLGAVLLATALPLAAGFVVSGTAFAQGLQYEGPGGVTSMPVASAQQGGDYERISQLEQMIRDLTNQLEQRDYQIRQLQTNFDKFQTDTSMRLQSLEQKLSGTITGTEPAQDSFETPAAPDTPPTPAAVENPAAPQASAPQATGNAPVSGSLDDPNAPFRPDSSVSGQPDRNLGQITESTGNKGDSLTAGKPQGGTSAAQAYDQAFAYLQQNNYVDAQRAFSEFLKNYGSHPLAANAQYWLGETYFAQTQYTTAAKTFAKAFQDHPQGQKAPDALLKLALTLDKMNKKDDACLTLQELSKRFPSGPASVTKRAAEEGQRMGCKS
ncbi:MAG: tol-pal system protein YbgF [Alphaproteobacteria bacterium]|nr:tol-pal system protein YbgF [Alphaproteobacteria bacterium]